tara:strand:- start:1037 stop:1264 length:228 start_codon:yes stop_codon:yes gene_type:complete
MSKIIKEELVVDSSAIQYAVYYPLTDTLFVLFTNGHAYDYLDVPRYVWEGLRASPSAGTFVNKILKKHNFKFRKL